MTTAQIMKRIPHRYPMLFIDKVLELDEGVRGVGIKCVTYNESFFQGHFPEQKIFPGALIMEAMAQMAAIVLSKGERASEKDKSDMPVFLAKVNNLKFTQLVVPGDQLKIEVFVKKRFARLALIEATAKVDEKVVASGEISLGG